MNGNNGDAEKRHPTSPRERVPEGHGCNFVLGGSAGGSMRQVLRPYRGRLLVGEDDLAFGAAPATDDVEALRHAWRVYRSGDPVDLADYAAGTSALPLLHEALSTLLLRYPDRRSGLGIVDESLLRLVATKGPKLMQVVAYTMGKNESLDHWGHDYLIYRLLRMADLDTPLVTLTERPTFAFTRPLLTGPQPGAKRTFDFTKLLPDRAKIASERMYDSEITLTAFGAAVLAGEANTVHENGIDDWIGGVHLTDAEEPPFREGRTLLLD